MNKSQKLRATLYVIGSAALKVAGIYGLVGNEESQAWLLLISGVLDLAFYNVDGGLRDRRKRSKELNPGNTRL